MDVHREYLCTVEQIGEKLTRLDRDIRTHAETSDLWPLIHALQALRGFSLLTATATCVELGDLRRFDSPRQLMSFLGLVPSEHSTGGSRQRGGITKAGNTHLRWMLVEAAWQYRRQPRIGVALRRRAEGVDPKIKQIAWKAQYRLNRRFRALVARGKSRQKAVTAVARELTGFVWAIGQEVHLEPR